MRGGIIMKFKNLLFLIPLLALTATMQSMYTPVQGPLQLYDTLTPGGALNVSGIITNTVINNPELRTDFQIIQNFANTLNPRQMTYQGIMNAIQNSHTPLATQALRAYENVIMYIYHKRAFIISVPYNPYLPVQGLRYSWLNPFSYINPYSWFGDNNAQLDQLLNEFEQLANIAHGKNPAIGLRMKGTIHSYRHWRKYMFTLLAYYLCTDLRDNEPNNTIIYKLLHMFDKSPNRYNPKAIMPANKSSMWQKFMGLFAKNPTNTNQFMTEDEIKLLHEMEKAAALREHAAKAECAAHVAVAKAQHAKEGAKYIAQYADKAELARLKQEELARLALKKHNQSKNPWLLNKFENGWDRLANIFSPTPEGKYDKIVAPLYQPEN